MPSARLLIIQRGRSVLTLRIHLHVLILMIEYVVVKDVVVASLLLKEVSIGVHVLFVWIHSNEVTFALVLQYRFLDHRIVRSLSLGRRSNRERTSLLFALRVGAADAVKLLFNHFW